MLLDLDAWKQRLADALPDEIARNVKIAESVAATATGIQTYPSVYVCNVSGKGLDVSGSALRRNVEQTRVSLVFKFRRLGDAHGEKRVMQLTEAMRCAVIALCGDRSAPAWICPDAFASDEIKMVDYATNKISDEILQGVLVFTVKTQI